MRGKSHPEKRSLSHHAEAHNEVTPLSMFGTWWARVTGGGSRECRARGGWLFHGPLALLTPLRGGGGGPFPKSTPKN